MITGLYFIVHDACVPPDEVHRPIKILIYSDLLVYVWTRINLHLRERMVASGLTDGLIEGQDWAM